MFARRPVAAAALAALAVGWGAIPLFVREDIPWQHLVASRVWLGAVTLVALMAVTGRLRLPEEGRGRIVVAGVLLALHWASFFWAVKLTTVAVALAVVYLGPVGAAAAAPWALGESVSRHVYGGLALAFAGVVIVARPGTGATLSGVAAAAVSAAAIAGMMLISKPALPLAGPLVVSAGELVAAAVVLSPWAWGAAGAVVAHPLPVLTLGVVFTGFSYFLYWSVMNRLPVAVVSVLMHLEPASAVVLAVIFLAERPDALQWLGIGMVIAGGLVAARDAAVEEVAGAPANL
jgi:drug/metabolite transporter (DMT)-like permease